MGNKNEGYNRLGFGTLLSLAHGLHSNEIQGTQGNMPPTSQCTPDVDSSAVLSTENKRVKEPIQNSICDETNFL